MDEGAIRVRADAGVWTVPPSAAAWMPFGVPFSIAPLPGARTRTVFLRRRQPARGRGACQVLHVSPLLRALVDHLDAPARPSDDETALRRLRAAVLDQVAAARELPLFVPALAAPLARRVAEALAADPADTPRMRELAAALGVSTRTLERAFVADAKMTLGEWRQRSRVCRAIELLCGGAAVKDVALEAGYETSSAFVAAFKRYTGMTPGKL
jgi:AraC-like DNA-binding protein